MNGHQCFSKPFGKVVVVVWRKKGGCDAVCVETGSRERTVSKTSLHGFSWNTPPCPLEQVMGKVIPVPSTLGARGVLPGEVQGGGSEVRGRNCQTIVCDPQKGEMEARPTFADTARGHEIRLPPGSSTGRGDGRATTVCVSDC